MPQRPDFYCFFYCAAWDPQRGAVTQRHGTGSRRLAVAVPSGPRRRPDRVVGTRGGRSSGSRGVSSKVQRQITAGRRGITGLVRCSMSPSGSIRRGR